MQQLEAISNIYYNLNQLIDGYKELPDTESATRELHDYINQHFVADFRERDELDCMICKVAGENERQGFIYGFKYAALLLVADGKGAAKCTE